MVGLATWMNTVALGVRGCLRSRMPAWRGVLSDKEIWEAVAYVLVLSHSSR